VALVSGAKIKPQTFMKSKSQNLGLIIVFREWQKRVNVLAFILADHVKNLFGKL
jgi:hypothetical protein